jgi:hypothetical protein
MWWVYIKLTSIFLHPWQVVARSFHAHRMRRAINWTRAWTRQFRDISLQMCTADDLPSNFVIYTSRSHMYAATQFAISTCVIQHSESGRISEWKFQHFTFKPKKIQLLLTYNAYKNVTRPPPKIPVITGFHPSAPMASSVQHAVKISLNIRILC